MNILSVITIVCHCILLKINHKVQIVQKYIINSSNTDNQSPRNLLLFMITESLSCLVSLIMNYTTITNSSVSVLHHEVPHFRLNMTPPATTRQDAQQDKTQYL